LEFSSEEMIETLLGFLPKLSASVSLVFPKPVNVSRLALRSAGSRLAVT
jgi:hypothetical protein